MDSKNTKASFISKGGLLTAFGVICIYLSTVMPVNKLYLLAIASCIIPLSVVTTNIKNALIIYVSTCILSILICGIKVTVISYIIFFGLYGVLKYYIEKIRKMYIEILLKLAFFNMAMLSMFLIYKFFFPNVLNLNISIYLVIIGSQFVFLIYDYVLTLFIDIINRKLKI
ncbi:hypothetical protein HBE96_02125 [Clostridium sp. P21]|uniref:Uncharacterized protein n=1 Tax=Clostridium muellerianum TaxID=2716538 RepID=A0A7Y0HLT1_9CLOT|nr:hypothetical protein [Clostridium muellerianum]NMM61515.1 hypothetical protein [Clostridium muellerianum]